MVVSWVLEGLVSDELERVELDVRFKCKVVGYRFLANIVR